MNPQKLLVAVIALLIISWPSYSDAGQGCCSWHGGQSYCDTSVGRWVCSDGTYSPSCGCSYVSREMPSTLEEAAKGYTEEKYTADLRQSFDSCIAIAKKRQSETDSCLLSLSTAEENSGRYYGELQDQKNTTFYVFLFAIVSVLLNIWLYKRTSK